MIKTSTQRLFAECFVDFIQNIFFICAPKRCNQIFFCSVACKPMNYDVFRYYFNGICYLKFTNCDEAHIKSNSKIHLDFNKINYNYDVNRTDISERLLEK